MLNDQQPTKKSLILITKPTPAPTIFFFEKRTHEGGFSLSVFVSVIGNTRCCFLYYVFLIAATLNPISFCCMYQPDRFVHSLFSACVDRSLLSHAAQPNDLSFVVRWWW